MPCIHNTSYLIRCPYCGQDEPTLAEEPQPDRWDNLLSLITQYGGARFTAGWRMAQATPTIKVDSTGMAEGDRLLNEIVHIVLAMQREAGDD